MTTWAFTDGDHRLVIQTPDGIDLSTVWLAILLMGDLAADGYEGGAV